jgi:hypothetical protein
LGRRRAEPRAALAALKPEERHALAAQWARARAEGRREDSEIIAGQDCGFIREVLPAAQVVRRIVEEAEHILVRRRRAAPSAPGVQE